VPAAAVVGEAMVAFVLADAVIEKFGGDAIDELVANWESFRLRTAARFAQK
jgi:chorismate synthase